MAARTEFKYEEALKRLEKLVADLDKPEVDLETRLKRSREATDLLLGLRKRLDQAKKDVEILIKKIGEDGTLEPFDAGRDDQRAAENA